MEGEAPSSASETAGEGKKNFWSRDAIQNMVTVRGFEFRAWKKEAEKRRGEVEGRRAANFRLD